MLLDFKISNYKSFYDETIFSMIPAPRQTGLDYSIQSEKLVQRNTVVYPLLLYTAPMRLEKRI